MGKAIKPISSSSHAVKGLPRKKLVKVTKKTDIINKYFRNLSTNFGTIPQGSSNRKRKREIEDCVPDVTHSDEQKRPKLIEEKHDFYDKKSTCSSSSTDFTKFEYKTKFLQSKDEVRDLFHVDEMKNSNEYTYYVDWQFHICDEISLEGLDGITIDALWSRLKNISSYPVLLEGKEELFWNFLKHIRQIEFHVLEAPRGKLIVYDRNSCVCPDSGIVLEPTVNHDDIYPYSMINKDGIKGSCSTYHNRFENTDIIRNLNLKEAMNIYGDRLVILASQKMRENAIISELSNPNMELVDNEYGLLEKVGRSRTFGELTQGKFSILNMIKDSRSIFHIRKSLEKKKLLKKQFFILRNLSTSQNKTGKLLHLPRFYRPQKSKTLLLIEEVVELLRRKPGYSLEFGEFKKYFPRSTGVNKIMKMPDFNKYIKTNIFRPYRFLYPNATTAEWKYKAKDKEKVLRIFQLIDPTVNVSACWYAPDVEQNSDDECVDDETPGNKLINSEFLKEVFQFIFNKGKEGVTLQEIEKKIEFDYYTIRIAVRKLQAKNVIDSIRSEHGKQRHILYFARCFHSKIPRPMPVSKPMTIPDNILQKILLPQRMATTSTLIKEGDLLFNGDKYLRNASISLPFTCQAFVREIESNSPMSISTEKTNSFSFHKNYSIDLTSEDINTKLHEFVRKNRGTSWNLASPDNIIITYSSDDLIMKLVLLKSVVFGIKLNILDMLEGNKNENVGLQDSNIDFEALANDRSCIAFEITNNYSKDYLLGPSPHIVHEEVTSENIIVTILLSTPPERYIDNFTTYITFDKNITPLAMFRTNTILELVNQSHIISDIYKLQKQITEIESQNADRKPGHGKIDKHTLNRVLLKLANEGYIKIFKIFLSADTKFKAQWIITHPSVDFNHNLMKIARDQMVLKFFLGMDKSNKGVLFCGQHEVPKARKSLPSPFDSDDITASINKLKEISRMKPMNAYKTSRQFGRALGYQPKFVRLQLLHELLFYLIYDYQPLDRMSHSDIEDALQYYNTEEWRQIPPIYKKGIDWKMFIPPLPVHKEWTGGWALLCDVILAMPLSLWVKLFHTALECPELATFMEHPVKRHYLVKDIPPEFRQVIMYRRRYLFNAVELIYRLCFIGLAQLGPQSPQVKDQIFFYLNKKVTLQDTSTSAPSYHKVTPKHYKQIHFNFSTKGEAEEYWCQLWTISMNTPLGQRTVMDGKSVTIENAHYKESLLKALKPKTPEQAKIEDIGEVPGDRQGAAGLDSSMWVHIKRNWLWATKSTKAPQVSKKDEQNIRNANIECIKPISIKYRELMKQNRKVFLPNERSQYEEFVNVKPKKSLKTRIIQRKISSKNKAPSTKCILDSKDKSIIKRVGKTFRALWSQREDRVLFICKAASYFLSTNSQKELIPRNLMRDVLHVLCPTSKDKTTATCFRRIIRMWKVDPAMKRVRDNSSNLINLLELSKYYSPIIHNINKSTVKKCPYSSFQITVAYAHLVFYMYKNIVEIEKILQGHMVTLDYFAPKNIHTVSPILVNVDKPKSDFSNPVAQDDVEKNVIRSVILSALNGSKLGQNTSYQLFKICVKYPDNLIRSAVASLKNNQAISLNKKSKSFAAGVKSMPFQLSITYTLMQKSTFTPLTMHTIYQNHLEIMGETAKFAEVDPSKSVFRYGRLLARNEIASVWPDINYLFNVPDCAYILNPYIKDRTTLTKELALLYQQYLKEKFQGESDPELRSMPINRELISFAEKKRHFQLIRNKITRLLMSLPCLCNRTIEENFSLFLEAKEASEFESYLSIFLESLINVCLNLINTEPDGVYLLQSYSYKYHRTKIIISRADELATRIFKVCHIIKQYLKHHHLTNIKDCFENEKSEGDGECEEFLRRWLEKTKINYQNPDGSLQSPDKNTKFYQSFFKYNKSKDETDNSVESMLNLNIENMEKIPQIDEIIKGMMVPPDSHTKRTVPYISELACLLSNEKFPDMNKDEKLLEELRSHFTIQYPILEGFIVEDIAEFRNSPSVKRLFDSTKKNDFKENIERRFLIDDADPIRLSEKIKENGGDASDVRFINELITYVFNRGILGATPKQIKVIFGSKVQNLDLVTALNILTESFIFLRTGISEILFVHHEFDSIWLVETFHLSPQENLMLQASGKDQLYKLKQRIESRIKSTQKKKVVLMPWIRIDGTLNLPLLEKWLTLVLSHCLDFPNCLFTTIFEKYYLIKPVELYFLLEVLQHLNCLKIFVNVEQPVSLFSAREKIISRPATVLDNFEDMYVEVHTLSSTCMGFYLDKELIEFA